MGVCVQQEKLLRTPAMQLQEGVVGKSTPDSRQLSSTLPCVVVLEIVLHIDQ